MTAEGRKLGRLTEIIETGSNDVFVVLSHRNPLVGESMESPNKTGEILVPVLDGVIVEVDTENGVMTIDPPAGLF